MPEAKRPLKVFLSYASQDKSVVRELSGRLANEGWIDPWVDEKKLLPGQDWRTKIEEAVETSDIVIICLSGNSVTKEGFVQKELRYAREIAFEKPEETIFLIPLRLDDCNVPRGLRFYQWGDYFGENIEETYATLLEALKLRYEQKLKIEEELARREKEKQEHVRSEKIAREKVEQDVAERITREKAEHEAIEKIAFEKAEREATEKTKREREEKAAREKLRLETTEKTKREKVERQAVRKAVLVESLSQFLITLKSTLLKAKPILRAIGTIGMIVILIWLGLWLMSKFPPSPPNLTATYVSLKTSTPTDIPYETEIVGDKGVVMRFVRAGEFIRGSNDPNYPDEHPVKQFFVGNFYIDKYEVTNFLYKACVDDEKCAIPILVDFYSEPKYANHPVVYVNWEMANAYCEWRGDGVRLPTEEEWEKAARGKVGQTYPWGYYLEGVKANYGNNNSGTLPVSSYSDGVSSYGIYNMAGNVREWVLNWYDVYPDGDPSVSVYFGELFRVVRGGSWKQDVTFIRAANRDYYRPILSTNDIGFRCARSVP